MSLPISTATKREPPWPCHQQQHALAAALLGFGHAGLHIRGRVHGLVADRQHHVAGLQALVGGIAVGIDLGDDARR